MEKGISGPAFTSVISAHGVWLCSLGCLPFFHLCFSLIFATWMSSSLVNSWVVAQLAVNSCFVPQGWLWLLDTQIWGMSQSGEGALLKMLLHACLPCRLMGNLRQYSKQCFSLQKELSSFKALRTLIQKPLEFMFFSLCLRLFFMHFYFQKLTIFNLVGYCVSQVFKYMKFWGWRFLI